MSKTIDLYQFGLDASVAVSDAFIAAREILPIIMEGQEKIAISEAILLIGCAMMWQSDIENETVLSCLQDIQESIDCAGSVHTEFWLTSDIAAIDKAKELSIEILPEYTMSDLRYKIHRALSQV